ncbi:MAG: intradiol ring-cleavage dioxygenase [Candidatus Rokubacteria bacterium]|nr:intradiol ring-cleavage dioxygenase [Candidatus Rokubacteria bacterium]
MRGMIALAGAIVVAGAAWGASLAPTPEQTLGPFYPSVLPEDRDADLLVIKGRADRAQGTVLHLTGRVTDTSGAPVADARIEIWQSDVYGRYLPPKDGAPGQRDPNFQGYGQTRTDAAGAYKFRTIRPVPYESRPPHIHVQVTHPRFRALVTQMYVVGEPGRENPAYFGGQRVRDALSVTLYPADGAEPGTLSTRFDIVLVPAR